MTEFRVTFGSQYGSEQYGADPHPVGGYDHVHRDGWWTIVAPDYDKARALVAAVLGQQWSDLYDAETHRMNEHLYPRGELLRLVHPDMARHAVHLLTGECPTVDGLGGEGRLLVTVWGNGTGEAAVRMADDPREPWGPPATLTPAP